jgi:hypothetical protein
MKKKVRQDDFLLRPELIRKEFEQSPYGHCIPSIRSIPEDTTTDRHTNLSNVLPFKRKTAKE